MPNYPEVDTDGTLHVHREGHTQTAMDSFLALLSPSALTCVCLSTSIQLERRRELREREEK